MCCLVAKSFVQNDYQIFHKKHRILHALFGTSLGLSLEIWINQWQLRQKKCPSSWMCAKVKSQGYMSSDQNSGGSCFDFGG